jgi:uncharacterized membrane protein
MAVSEKNNKIIMTGVMMAIIAISTMIIAIPVPFTNGYIHLGDSMIFLSVLIFGWRYGAIAAGVGSALADLFLGYVHWAPWTLCVKGIMALLMGLMIEKSMKNRRNVVVSIAAISAFWVAFHFAVNWIIRYEATHNPANLLSDEIVDVSALGAFLQSMQSQLMLVALLIPVFLIVIALVLKKKENYTIPIWEILGMTLAGLWMVFGYYIAGGILYGNFAVSAFSIPMNVLQFILGFLVAALITAALSKTPAAKFFTFRIRQ